LLLKRSVEHSEELFELFRVIKIEIGEPVDPQLERGRSGL
jgi:hypothetical protein